MIREASLAHDVPAVQAAIARRMRDIAGADVAVFCSLHPPRQAYAPVCSDGDDVANWVGAEFHEAGPIVRWFQVNEETLRLPDEHRAERFIDEAGRQVIEARQVRACVPLLSAGQLLGIVLVASGRPDAAFTREEAAFLTVCGRQAALLVEAAINHETEISRVRAAERAERLAVAGQLAANVAHEVRNPLTIIRSTLQIFCNSSRPMSELAPMVNDLVVEIDRIDRIVGGLLKLGQPVEPRDAPFDLGQVLVEGGSWPRRTGTSRTRWPPSGFATICFSGWPGWRSRCRRFDVAKRTWRS